MFGLRPPFVHFGATSLIPHCVGPSARWRTVVEVGSSSAPGVLALVRVMLSRTVITYSTPSAPPAGTSQFHRMGDLYAMTIWPISTRVNSPSNDDEQLLEEIELTKEPGAVITPEVICGSSSLKSAHSEDSDTPIRRTRFGIGN